MFVRKATGLSNFLCAYLIGCSLFFQTILLSGQRSSYGDHRCVTPLYCIPMWIFDCVMG